MPGTLPGGVAEGRVLWTKRAMCPWCQASWCRIWGSGKEAVETLFCPCYGQSRCPLLSEPSLLRREQGALTAPVQRQELSTKPQQREDG